MNEDIFLSWFSHCLVQYYFYHTPILRDEVGRCQKDRSIVSTAGHIYGPYRPILREALYKMSSRIILPSVSQGPLSPSLSTLHQVSSVSPGPRCTILYWFSKLCFLLKLNWQNYCILSTLSRSAVQFEVAKLEPCHSECTVLPQHQFTDECTQK